MSMKSKVLAMAALAGMAAMSNGEFEQQTVYEAKPDRSPRSVTPLTKKQKKARKLNKIGKETRRRNRMK